MDVHQTRITNFLALFRQYRDANSHLPNRGMLKSFSERVGVSPVYLSHVKCGRKEIGGAVARKIEAACGHDVGWLDQSHGETDPRDADERMLVEQILAIYRLAPGKVKRLITDAIKEALSP